MDNNLKILVTASLNEVLSKNEINSKILSLQGQIDKLNLTIKIDDNILKTLNDFSTQMSKIADVAKNTGKIIEKSLNPDGSSFTRTYYNGLKGEFSDIVTEAKKAGDAQLKSLNDVTSGFTKTTNEAQKYNAELQKIAETVKLTNDNGTKNRTVNLNGQGGVTGYTDTTNYAKQKQLDEQAAKEEQDLINQIEQFRLQSIQKVQQRERAWETAQAQAINKNAELERQETAKTQATRQKYEDWWLKSLANRDQQEAKQGQLNQQKLIADQDKLTQSLKKMYDQGLLNEQFFTNFNKAINNTKNVEEVDKLQSALQRVSQYTKNQNLQQSLLSQSQSLLSSGKNVDTAGLSSLVTNLNNLKLSGENATRELSLMQNQLKGYQASATVAAEETTALGNVFKSVYSNLGMYLGGITLFFQAFNSFKNGISTINELNKSLTTIGMILHENQTEVAQLGDQYQKLGNSLSISTTEIAKSATELIRQGLSMDEVNSRLKIVSEFSKVAGLSAEEATTYVTAATNSMGISATKATDTFAALGHASGVNAGYIATAFQKVGGTAGALGLDFQKVASYISTIGERTKESAETIGQSVKSIIARYQQIREKGYSEEDGTKINQVAKALAIANISIVDSKGQFVDFTKTLDQLGEKWSTLDSRQKAYIATAVAGTYQQSRFLDLMQGYGRSVDLYNKALDSSGAVQQKFNVWQQGTEAQIEKLKNSFQGFWMSAFNSSEVQTIVASLNGIVTGLKTVTSTVGFLPAVFSVAGVAIIAFNGGLKSIMTNGMLTIATLKGIPSGLMTLESALAVTTLKTNALNMASRALTMTMNGLKAAGTFLAGAILPMLAFAAVGIVIEKITQAISDYKQKQAEIKQQQEDLVQSYSAHSEQIKQLASDYDKLSSKVTEGKLSSSSQEYVDNMNKLGQLMPSLVSSEDEHGNKILRSRDAVKEELEYAQKLKEVNDKMSVDTFSNKLDAQKNKMQDLIDQIAKLDRNSSGQDAPALLKAKGIVQVSQETKDSNDLQKITLQHQLNSMAKESSSLIKEQVNAMMDQDKITDKLSSSQKKLVETYIDQAAASAKSIDTPEKLSQFMQDASNNAIALAKDLAPLPNVISDVIDATNLNKNQKDVLKSISDEIKNGYTNWESYREVLIKVGIPLDTVDNLINKLKESTDKNTKSLVDYASQVQDTYDAEMKKATSEEAMLGTTQKLINNSKDLITTYQLLSHEENLSADQRDLLAEATGKLTAMYPQYIENGQLNIERMRKETEANDILLKAINDVAAGHASAEEMMTLNQSMQAKNRLEVMSAELTAMKTLMDTYNRAAQHQEDMALATGDDRALIQAQKFHNAAQQTASEYDNVKKSIDAMIPSFDSSISKLADATGYQGQYYSAADKSNSKTKDSIYVTDKYKQSIDALNAAISNLEALQKKYPNDSQQYRDAMQKEIDLLQQKNQLIKDQAINLQHQIDSGNIQQYGMITNSSISSSSSSPRTLSGSNNAEQIWNFLKSKGLSDGAAAGIMGNLQQESGLNPNAPGGGLAQWIGSRGSALRSYASQNGLSSNSLEAQLGYLWQEISSGSEGVTTSALNGMSASDAAQYFSNKFERPGKPMMSNRINYANQFYNQYNGFGTVGSSSSSTGGQSAADKAQAIDQAKATLLGLNQDIVSVTDQIDALKIAIVQSKIDQVTNTAANNLNGIDNAIKNSQAVMSRYAANTAVWNAETQKQISLTSAKVDVNAREEAGLRSLLQTEALTYDQRQKINDQLLALDQNSYTYMNDINALMQKQRDAQTTDKVNAITKAYNDQIAALQAQATELDKINNQLQRNQQLQDLQNQIDKAKSDTSHQYIDSSGKVTYTYDKTAVANLEKQKTDLLSQWQQQDQKDALNQKITDLGTQRDNVVAQIQQINQYYATKGYQDRKDLQDIMNQFVRDLSKIMIPTDPTSATGITAFVNSILKSLGITIPKHHDGGIVGGSDGKNANLINALFNIKPNEQVVKALKGEVMIPQSNIPNFLQNMKTMVHSFSDKASSAVQPMINYNMSNFTIKSDNAEELFRELDVLTRSQ